MTIFSIDQKAWYKRTGDRLINDKTRNMKTTIYYILLGSLFLFHFAANAQHWSEVGGLNSFAATGNIACVSVDPSGKIFTGGDFYNSSFNQYVAEWDGSTWSELGGLNGLAADASIRSICRSGGIIYAGGEFSNSGAFRYVAKWNGSAWSELGGLNGLSANRSIYTICSDPAGNVYAAGNFTNGATASTGKEYVAKWNGTTWSELGGTNALGADSTIWSICSDPAGNIYATGIFNNAGGKKYVATWNGTAWSELGGPNALGANDWIMSVSSDTLGNLYAAGYFTNSSGKKYVAKWNGTAWSEVGGLNALAANDAILSIYSRAPGNIYAAGLFTNTAGNYYVARWDGTSWSELGGANSLAANGLISCVEGDAQGNIYAGGNFKNSSFNNYIAEFSNGSGIPAVSQNSLEIFPNPSNGNFTIVFPAIVSKGSVEIDNILGERIFDEALNPGLTDEISLRNISQGIYFVNVYDGEKHYCRKLFIK